MTGFWDVIPWALLYTTSCCCFCCCSPPPPLPPHPPPPSPPPSPAPPQSVHAVLNLGCQYSLPLNPTDTDDGMPLFHSHVISNFSKLVLPFLRDLPIFIVCSIVAVGICFGICWFCILFYLLSLYTSCFIYFYLSFRNKRTN